jgi:hypothetical protein
VVIDYEKIEKRPPQELSLLQRFAAVRPKGASSIPAKTTLRTKMS